MSDPAIKGNLIERQTAAELLRTACEKLIAEGTVEQMREAAYTIRWMCRPRPRSGK